MLKLCGCHVASSACLLQDGTSVEGSPQRTKKAAERAAAQACLHQLEETFPGILKASTTKTKDTKILITGYVTVFCIPIYSERQTGHLMYLH